MKLKVLGSSSSGNCYILESDAEALIIEAGVPFREVKVAIGFNVRKIVGVICTHRHNDHIKYLKDFVTSGIRSIAPNDYWMEHITEWWFQYGERYDETRKCIDIGNFKVMPFLVVHDVPCYGFYIKHPDIGYLIYASDTEYIKYRFKNINHIIVEANHSIDLVDRNAAKYEHQIRGHMSIETTCNFLEVNKNPLLLNVVLCHLSQDSADEKLFLDKAKDVVDCNVYIASKGLEIPLDLYPF